MRLLMKENQDLREENLKLSFEISKLKKELGKVKPVCIVFDNIQCL